MGLELLLPVVFFLITLIIIYLLRVEDRRDRRLDLIKKRMGDFSSEVERVIQNFRDTAQITEERITKRAESSKALTARLDEQLADLQGRSDDLSKLQEVLNTYRDSISRLGATTATVEGRIGQVRREVERLEAVNGKIQEFDKRLEERMSLLDRFMEEEDARWEDFSKKLERRYGRYQRENEELRAQNEAFIETAQASFVALEQRFELLSAEHSRAIEADKGRLDMLLAQSREAFDELCRGADEQCQERLDTFKGACDTELQTMVQTAADRIDDAFKTMVEVIIGFVQELEDRASQSEELNEVLVRQQQANLAEYSEEIQLLQQLSTQSESAVRRDELRRRELLEVRTHLREETLALRSELGQMIREKQALLSANAQAKQEQENLQSALAHLSLSLIERQDELIRSNDTEPFIEDEGTSVFGDEPMAEEEEIVEEELDTDEDGFDDEPLIDEEEITEEEQDTDDDSFDDEPLIIDEEEIVEEELDANDDSFDDDLLIDEEEIVEEELDANDDSFDDEPLLDEEEIVEEELDTDDGSFDDDEDMTALQELSVSEALVALDEEAGSEQEDDEAAVLDDVHEAEVPSPSDASVQEERAWVEYIPEGDEEEISLDDDDDLNP